MNSRFTVEVNMYSPKWANGSMYSCLLTCLASKLVHADPGSSLQFLIGNRWDIHWDYNCQPVKPDTFSVFGFHILLDVVPYITVMSLYCSEMNICRLLFTWMSTVTVRCLLKKNSTFVKSIILIINVIMYSVKIFVFFSSYVIQKKKTHSLAIKKSIIILYSI